jgi:hypothetical protein
MTRDWRPILEAAARAVRRSSSAPDDDLPAVDQLGAVEGEDR